MQSYVSKIESERSNVTSSSALLKEIGMVLRDAREKKSLSIREVKEATCIPIHHITAIESGDRTKLPEDFYLIGFIKRFARVVDVSEAIIMGMISRERKYKSPRYESEAFDLLFNRQEPKQKEQEEQEEKVVRLQNRKKYLNKETIEKSFFKVYHFYLLVGMILFVTALHMIFQALKTDPDELKTTSTLVVEDGKPVFIAMSKDKIVMQPKEKSEEKAKDSDEIIVDEIKENENIQDVVEPNEEVSWGEVDLLNKKQADIESNVKIKPVVNVVKSPLPKNPPKVAVVMNKPISKPVVVQKKIENKSTNLKIAQITKPKETKKIAEVKLIPKQNNITLTKNLAKNEDVIRLRPLRQQAYAEAVKQSDGIRLRPLAIN